jgi:hypothetical protein
MSGGCQREPLVTASSTGTPDKDTVVEDGEVRFEYLTRGCGNHRCRLHEPVGRRDRRDRLAQVEAGVALVER